MTQKKHGPDKERIFFGHFSGRNRSSKAQILAKNTPNDANQSQTTKLKSSLPKIYVKKRPQEKKNCKKQTKDAEPSTQKRK